MMNRELYSSFWRRRLVILGAIALLIVLAIAPVSNPIKQLVTTAINRPSLPKVVLADLIASDRLREALSGDVLNQDWGVPQGGDFDAQRDSGKRRHQAYDLARSTEAATLNQFAYAPSAGKVEFIYDDNCGYGLRLSLSQVSLDLVYCHLANARIKIGRVKAGDRIATVGKSGSANYPGGAHLHVSGRDRATNIPMRLNKKFLEKTVVMPSKQRA
jgi:hypothetical protein